MLLIKLGLLAFLGKSFYSGFLMAHLIQHSTHSLKRKINKHLEGSSCSLQQD
jgi:hypothetical protein